MRREDLYFEPRCVTAGGAIYWYGGVYVDRALMGHTEETVYIRDDGKFLYVYEFEPKPIDNKKGIQIECTFKLIVELKKHMEGKRYGRLLKRYAI